MAIISNWDDTLDTVLESTNIRKYFEKVFGSYSLGVEKPDREIFRLALHEMAVDSRHAWHVGDSLDNDVEGAMAAGIRPILIDYFGKYDGAPPGVPLARSLSDVAQILDGKTQAKQIGNLEDSGTKRYLASIWKNR
ncbi:MAG TPA: HAD-IA family hydrolase [bacterium]|nr:HAD-IA family hydrolase [bacterium]HQL63302.1 HAD-IA family hydrolase [bacterium]